MDERTDHDCVRNVRVRVCVRERDVANVKESVEMGNSNWRHDSSPILTCTCMCTCNGRVRTLKPSI